MTDASLAEAVALLQAGGVIGLPTETVYGLAANAADEQAVASIYRIKGRPADHPLIVHVVDAQAAQQWAEWTPTAQRLADAFWPGPLTLVLRRRADAPAFASAGQDTIALRVSSHPVFQRLMQALAPVGISGLAAPSANRFGRISPSRAAHVRSGLGSAVPLVLDGGPSEVGVESTIVDLSRGAPVLLRPGGISLQALADCLGQPVRAADSQATREADAPRVPGALPSHYAPSVPLRLLSAGALAALLQQRATALSAAQTPVIDGRSSRGSSGVASPPRRPWRPATCMTRCISWMRWAWMPFWWSSRLSSRPGAPCRTVCSGPRLRAEPDFSSLSEYHFPFCRSFRRPPDGQGSAAFRRQYRSGTVQHPA